MAALASQSKPASPPIRQSAWGPAKLQIRTVQTLSVALNLDLDQASSPILRHQNQKMQDHGWDDDGYH
ncbi:hypothetical protein CCHR01_18867 [Colletotrichum chrysophilum]|uniref:Uncharacterized protein n=1 Tax=Colletotrichum chrysophilum TaxID=1836956 RepID=A0AAD8ZZA1_9PEZI|nr:hypothetical protein CCHR01_18867 [Colletotrichum chrysophilum]